MHWSCHCRPGCARRLCVTWDKPIISQQRLHPYLLLSSRISHHVGQRLLRRWRPPAAAVLPSSRCALVGSLHTAALETHMQQVLPRVRAVTTPSSHSRPMVDTSSRTASPVTASLTSPSLHHKQS